MNTIRTMICGLILICICSPLNGNEWGNGWGFEPVEVSPPEAYDVFMGGILAQQQETICINGVCYPVTSTVTEWTPVTNGEVFEAPQEVSVMTEICPICGKPKTNSAVMAANGTVMTVATAQSRWRPFRNFVAALRSNRIARLSARQAMAMRW